MRGEVFIVKLKTTTTSSMCMWICANNKIRKTNMANLTLSIDDQLLNKSREYAKSHHTSLNNLIRNLLTQTIGAENRMQSRIAECLAMAESANGHSQGKKWKREDLYES
jgi:hypothetical protein